MSDQKKVLVVGIARSGIPAVKALKDLGYSVILNDLKPASAFEHILPSLKDCYDDVIFGKHPTEMKDYDLVLVSPGVPLDLPFLEEAKRLNIEIMGELELGFQLAQGTFYGITGTNGKTTTTALTGQMFMAAGMDTRIAGNIGDSVVGQIAGSTSDTHWITEISSFQLETIHKFHPKISAILNVTPDHLNRHKTMGNYIGMKRRIFENEVAGDIVILNADNAETDALSANVSKAQVVRFSRLKRIEGGVYVDHRSGQIVIEDFTNGQKVPVIETGKIFIPGSHNLENALAATAIAYYAGIEPEVIAATLSAFKGVEHRIEFVDEIDGVVFYNDSKGTNPDASIKAVEAMTRPTILIAGGMDKGSEFDSLIESFAGHVVKMIVLGETAPLLKKTAERLGFDEIIRVADMNEAVVKAKSLAKNGWAVLLSPACASWDMYENFEKRGAHFKRCVEELR
jgi:UDP-N-acetylmuramoylalanine--D-glutamate ligase